MPSALLATAAFHVLATSQGSVHEPPTFATSALQPALCPREWMPDDHALAGSVT